MIVQWKLVIKDNDTLVIELLIQVFDELVWLRIIWLNLWHTERYTNQRKINGCIWIVICQSHNVGSHNMLIFPWSFFHLVILTLFLCVCIYSWIILLISLSPILPRMSLFLAILSGTSLSNKFLLWCVGSLIGIR